MKITSTLAALAATAALTALTGCGSDDADKSTADAAWSFTDGRGTTIKLDKTPERLVVQSSIAAALSDYGIDTVAVFGPLRDSAGDIDPQAAGLNLDKVTDVTGKGEYGDLEMEKLAGLRPDLLITNMFVPPELWYVNAATEKKVDGLTKTLGIDFKGKGLVESIEAVREVAEALGGDVDSEEAEEAKQAFDEASDRLREIGEELGDRKVLVTSATTDLLYVADPAQFPDLAYLTSLGVPIVTAKASAGSYWEELSWEKADKYDADIVMWDSRDGDGLLKLLKGQPAFGQITGAKAGDYVAWQAVAPPSYRAYADVLDELADRLEEHV